MIITKYILVKMGGKNIKHYKKLGYKVKLFQVINVPIEHVTDGSHYLIDVKCDYCGRIVKKVYKSFLNERKNSVTKKDCCSNCIKIKNKETNIKKYGVENPMHRDDVKEKLKNIFLSILGVDNPTKDPAIRKRAGEAQKNMTDEQKRNRKEKTKKTMMERYGVKSPLQMESTRRNLFLTRTAESSQQKRVYNILVNKYGIENVKKNFSVSKLSLDILVTLNNTKIDVEYDSWYWHEKNRDRRRDEFLKGLGYKILRIKSGRKIPEEEILFRKIEKLVNSKNKFSSIVLDDWNDEEYGKEGGIK